MDATTALEPRPNFPTSLPDFKKFVADHLLNTNKIDDAVCAGIIEKVQQGRFEFTDAERAVMRAIVNIGVVCECDEDHRIGPDNKSCELSYL